MSPAAVARMVLLEGLLLLTVPAAVAQQPPEAAGASAGPLSGASPSPGGGGGTTGAASTAAAPVVPLPAMQETIYRGEATGILGRSVAGPDGGAVGRIVDVLVDEAGQPRAVVIDLGGFMGIGNRRIAIAWRALRFAPSSAAGRGSIALEMTADQVRATPEYKPAAGQPTVTIATPPPPPAGAAPATSPTAAATPRTEQAPPSSTGQP